MTQALHHRRALGRALTRILNAPAADVLKDPATPVPAVSSTAHRLGFTGAPGAGKSSLISLLARRRLARGRCVGVLAVDPTSPVSGGSVLGDRIRMDAVAEDPRLYIRSVPSRSAHDGLCANVAELLLAMEGYGFDDVILETVGVGQAEVAVRALVDTLILVLLPESGDTVQAMKAGILEMGDVFVVNKADLPGARSLAREIGNMVRARAAGENIWRPPVVMVSTRSGDGIDEMDMAIEAHRTWLREHDDPRQRAISREKYRLRSLLTRRIERLVDELDDAACLSGVEATYGRLMQRLCACVEEAGRPDQA